MTVESFSNHPVGGIGSVIVHTVKEAFLYLESFTNLEKGRIPETKRDFRLDRMRLFLDRLNYPHLSFKTIHIAGTKGKGSTGAMMGSVLEEAGFKTGVYSSPHVSSYLERIRISNGPPSDESIVRGVNNLTRWIVEPLQRLPGEFPPTTFELLTLLAFLLFREQDCTFAVIETGIGGRLDATNIVRPVACLITPLDLEHTHLLGKTIESIAYEKGGIIKRGVPVFCSHQKTVALDVFHSIGRARGAPIFSLDEELEQLDCVLERSGMDCEVKLRNRTPLTFRLALNGLFQAENAALASLALVHLLPFIPIPALERGMRKTSLPGRLEIIDGTPPIILDGAHTPLAAERLMESYRKLFPERGILIFGSVIGKNPADMAGHLVPYFDAVIISTPGSFKESEPDTLYEMFKKLHGNTQLELLPHKALEKAMKLSGGKKPILVTGSFYMISEIRKELMEADDEHQMV